MMQDMTPEQQRALALARARRRREEAQSDEQRRGQNLGEFYGRAVNDVISRVPVLSGMADALPRSLNLSDEVTGLAARGAVGARNAIRGESNDAGAAARAAADQERGQVAQYRQDNPIRSFIEEGVAQGGAAMLMGPTAVGQAATRAATARPIATAAGLGALEGGVSGAGAGQTAQERLRGGAIGAGIGAGAGAALAGAGQLASRALTGEARRAIPEIDQLQAAKQAAYQQVDDMGARYSRDSVEGLFSGIRRNAEFMNLNPSRHPAAASTLDQLESIVGEGDVSLTRLDQLRQVLRRDVASSTDPAERAFGQMMIEQVDEYIQKSGPADMVAGAAEDAANAIMVARSANQRFRKSELVADAIERARLRAASTGSGGNEENAIRQNLRNLVQPGSRTRSFFNDAERELILQAVEGDTLQNALRLVSRFAPSSGGLSAILGVGGVASVPQFAVPAMMLGEAGKRGAELRQGAMIDAVERMVRTGSATPPPSSIAAPVGVGSGIFGGTAAARLRAEEEDRRRQMGPR